MSYAYAFQSHFGSIGALRDNVSGALLDNFQSHFGSIGALVPPVESLHSCLLSIPLWFDWGLYGQRLERLQRLFQSHFGSIGAHSGGRRQPVFITFQSHFGSIGAQHAHRFALAHLLFQSHFGSIGAWPWRPYVLPPTIFQSHFGSIGAWPSPPATTPASPALSIPLWFDWGPYAARRQRPRSNRFQSHFGSIGAGALGPAHLPTERLSIPLWFDWGWEHFLSAPATLSPFNPTLVRLGLAGYWRI